jgi:hypothetical protein
MQMIKTSVMAATVRRAIQLIPRLTHHNSAQLITTGTTISSCNPRHLFARCVRMKSRQNVA